jgi:antitoxin VapB
MTVAIITSMRERLVREERKRESQRQLIADIMAIADHCASLPVLDNRSDDEIMGWDENGLPS